MSSLPEIETIPSRSYFSAYHDAPGSGRRCSLVRGHVGLRPKLDQGQDPLEPDQRGHLAGDGRHLQEGVSRIQVGLHHLEQRNCLISSYRALLVTWASRLPYCKHIVAINL